MSRAWVVHAVLYLALFAGLLVGLSRQQDSIDTQRQASVHACERLRVVRAYLRTDASRSVRDPAGRRALADRLMPLVDCEQAFDDGNGALLSPAATAEFLRLVERGIRPVVRDGRVQAPK